MSTTVETPGSQALYLQALLGCLNALTGMEAQASADVTPADLCLRKVRITSEIQSFMQQYPEALVGLPDALTALQQAAAHAPAPHALAHVAQSPSGSILTAQASPSCGSKRSRSSNSTVEEEGQHEEDTEDEGAAGGSASASGQGVHHLSFGGSQVLCQGQGLGQGLHLQGLTPSQGWELGMGFQGAGFGFGAGASGPLGSFQMSAGTGAAPYLHAQSPAAGVLSGIVLGSGASVTAHDPSLPDGVVEVTLAQDALAQAAEAAAAAAAFGSRKPTHTVSHKRHNCPLCAQSALGWQHVRVHFVKEHAQKLLCENMLTMQGNGTPLICMKVTNREDGSNDTFNCCLYCGNNPKNLELHRECKAKVLKGLSR